ncbi:NADH-quinone oxidoreductase subunit H [bacterium]|nr:MAG: NADH-quinone oxidoreductase subunit H [bacterium]
MFHWIAERFLNAHPAEQALWRALLWVVMIFGPVPVWIWWERKLLAYMQDRVGPNRTGTITFSRTSNLVPGFLKGRKLRILNGLPQIIADGVKSFFKEDFAPGSVDRFVFFLAPALALFPAFAIGAMLPFAPWASVTPVADVNIGVLYTLGIASLGAYGVILAGYGSNNKYALLGGLRASAQLISYELAMGMALGATALFSGSLRPRAILEFQEGPLWGAIGGLQNWFVFTPFGLVALVVFMICALAETNRAPFDLPECESELVAGYNTEYSTKKWVLFMMGEYINMFIFAMLGATVFLGGYNLLPVRWEWLSENVPALRGLWDAFGSVQYYLAPLFFILKGALLMSAYIWVRGSFPRLRYDQLMNLGWKWLLPIGTANFTLIAGYLVLQRVYGPWLALLVSAVALVAFVFAIGAFRRSSIRGKKDNLVSRRVTLVEPPAPERRGITMVDPNVEVPA